jgi:hypothetical protein
LGIIAGSPGEIVRKRNMAVGNSLESRKPWREGRSQAALRLQSSKIAPH